MIRDPDWKKLVNLPHSLHYAFAKKKKKKKKTTKKNNKTKQKSLICLSLKYTQ
jgi:hypothetical protein